MPTETIQIEPIPVFDDNYIWLLHDTRNAVVIDPGDATPVIQVLEQRKLKLCDILITHHHSDHIDGVTELIDKYEANVYAPAYEAFKFQHTALKSGDVVALTCINLTLEVLWLPGHTLGHIAYLNRSLLFCGDVLFGAGCGRLFEGTPEQMLNSLNTLKQLPPEMQVYCTHEYTAQNINFALTLEPKNPDLLARQQQVANLRQNNLPSLPSTIGLELKTNPFLRCDQEAIIESAKAQNKDELSIFSKIRTDRNHY